MIDLLVGAATLETSSAFCPPQSNNEFGVGAATLQVSRGTAVQASVTFLAPDALHHMHATEGSYNLLRLEQVSLHLCANLGTFRSVSVSRTLLRLSPLSRDEPNSRALRPEDVIANFCASLACGHA